MSFHKIVAVMVLLAIISQPASAEKGGGAFERGTRAEQKGDLDAAYGFFRDANSQDPSNAKFAAAFTRVRFKASDQHVHAGKVLASSGALSEALLQFQTAVNIDSSSGVAQQELQRTAEMIRQRDKQQSVQRSSSPLVKELGKPLELQPLSKSPITLYLTNNADIAYKTVGKLAGLNVIVDPDYKPQKVSIDLTNVTLREALDMVALESKTFWRPVLANTIFVAADTGTKRKEFEQNVMRTFYLKNIESPADLQEAANAVKQMLDVSRVQLLQAQDAILVRGTPDQLTLAEKVLADFDQPRSEVIIDVSVMQVSRDRIKNLGSSLPTSFNVGYAGNTTSGTGGGSGSGGSLALNALKTLSGNSFAVSVPGASLTILASDSNTKVLQNPQIRALNDQKATLRIGDRVPVATGSYSSGVVGGASVSPLIGTQFTYLDVGVNIDITPHVHSNGEVTLKMSLEISSVTGEQNIGGITEPTIGQRRIEQETRLANGEVNLLGGILEDTETQSLSGYPLLSRIPILKYLFAQDNKQRTQDEIIFAITPHIVRSQEIDPDSIRTVEVGTGSATQLRSATQPGGKGDAAPGQQSPTPQVLTPPAPAPNDGQPAAPTNSAPPPVPDTSDKANPSKGDAPASNSRPK